MLGDSTVLGAAVGSSAAGGAGEGGSHEGGETSAAAAAGGPGGVGSNSGDDERGGRGEEGDRSFGGNRWPRQETLALLQIRSDMDVSFRDASVKGPLWEEVSRKLAELGYNRSAKKCKEKFENVYKYHRRTKEGRTGKPDGKAYRFFDQLEALETLPSMQSSSITPSKPQAALQATPLSVNTAVATAMASMPNTNSATPVVPHVTVPSTTTTIPMTMSQGIGNPSMNMTFSSYPPPPPQANPTNLPTSITNPTYPHLHATIPSTAFQSIPTDMLSNSSSSSTSSDEELEGRRKRKRKWKDFFERLMKEVIDKQENLQKRFLEAIEKREHDRMVREEAWRSQEMERINREREILAQERSIAAAKDAAVMSFLQKIAEQHNLGTALNNINLPQPPPPPPPPVQQQPIHITPPPQAHPQPFLQPQQKQAVAPTQQHLSQPVATNVVSNLELTKAGNSDQIVLPASSSRWPKVEVQALIKLRKSLDAKYQENGPKGPLWEEISAAMRKLGYNRNAKRCKEKWENINKYFKKVKDSNKKRPEDSKTCPYFHLLDALYKEKNTFDNSSAADDQLKPESLMSTGAPLMVRPEQQWPPQQDMRPETGHGQGPDVSMEDLEGHHEDDDEDDEDKDGDDEDEEDEGGCNFEIVASKPASMGTAE